MPEKVIDEFTGHKSPKALHHYERTSIDQVQTECSVISRERPNDRIALVAWKSKKDSE